MKSLEELTSAIQHINISRQIIPEAGNFPNNALLPLMIYRKALQSTNPDLIENIFESNGWFNFWRAEIYNYDHYHSNTHEVLGVFKGNARLMFGGPSGITIPVEEGDVIIIPAGVSHKRLESDPGFQVVGGYPDGKHYDIMKGDAGDRPLADENIRHVALPASDPVYGTDGPLLKEWKPRD